MSEIVVIALGGNAIKQAHQQGTTAEQFKNVDVTAQQIAKIVETGRQIVITHGNGPQAGALLIQQEEADHLVAAQTLATCGAMTQGQIGWMMQNRVAFHLKQIGLKHSVCTVVTQVIVSAEDADFQDPSKPVGPFYTEQEAALLRENNNYIVKDVKPGTEKGWRRVVPSPEPLEIVEADSIAELLQADIIVIASGGGGIPVTVGSDGSYNGVDAVIDKDRAGFKLAQGVQADRFLILTDVEQAYLNYNGPDQQALGTITVDEAQGYLNQGHFLKGSMGPKIQAGIRFARWSGKETIITSLDRAVAALAGQTGTHIKG
jgi:carbamate kinase